MESPGQDSSLLEAVHKQHPWNHWVGHLWWTCKNYSYLCKIYVYIYTSANIDFCCLCHKGKKCMLPWRRSWFLSLFTNLLLANGSSLRSLVLPMRLASFVQPTIYTKWRFRLEQKSWVVLPSLTPTSWLWRHFQKSKVVSLTLTCWLVSFLILYYAFALFHSLAIIRLWTQSCFTADAIGQIITVGELEELEANNKPTTKIDFEIRDQM